MEPLALVVGIGLIAFILVYLANSVKVNDTFMTLLRLFLFVFALFTVLLLGKAMLDNTDNCDIVLNQTTTYTNLTTNITTEQHQYMQYCEPNIKNTELTIFVMINRIIKAFFTFLGVYLFYRLMSYFGILAKLKLKWERYK